MRLGITGTFLLRSAAGNSVVSLRDMAVIVDANQIAAFYQGTDPDLNYLRSVVEGGKCRLHFGGKLRKEIQLVNGVEEWLAELDRAGRAKAIPDAAVDADEKTLSDSGICRSDDPHVLALARVGGARLLATDDGALMDDFRDRRIISTPRGNIYQYRTQVALVRKHSP